MEENHFFNRDLSWLTFNGRVLQEAARDDVTVMERVNFLSIFSSNLDEFYRVRMPVLQAMESLGKFTADDVSPLVLARQQIMRQQTQFGNIFTQHVIPLLAQHNVYLLLNEPPSPIIKNKTDDYFNSEVMAFLRPIDVLNDKEFEPANNQLYFLVTLKQGTNERAFALQIPTDNLPRFF